MLTIAPLGPADRAAWEKLSRGYNDFYETVHPPEVYDRTWARLMAATDVHGLGAHRDARPGGGLVGNSRLVGIAHYFFHANVWRDDVCYLQDLFVDEAARGQGAARALIDAVADAARRRGASRYYWQTKQDNKRARGLYDKVAEFRGFIRYDYPLD
jgi:GNAT superfamily N-acetyltransferase